MSAAACLDEQLVQVRLGAAEGRSRGGFARLLRQQVSVDKIAAKHPLLPRPRLPWRAEPDTEDALLAVALCARVVARGDMVHESDVLRLADAAQYFDVIGTWSACADALLVRAMELARRAVHQLEAADLDRLCRIVDRMHAHLDRLETGGRT